MTEERAGFISDIAMLWFIAHCVSLIGLVAPDTPWWLPVFGPEILVAALGLLIGIPLAIGSTVYWFLSRWVDE